MQIEAISVTKLNQYIKTKIDTDEYLNNVFVKGEISNFKHHYTGHMYFTLKDENSLVKCIMFKSYTTHLAFQPKDGMKVKILGSVSVFERDGVYQIYCKAMQEDGLGDLYTKYLELKNKLELEGLFEQSKKKKIPYYSRTIGVLTSETGAVIRDIINVSTRRNPNVYIKLLPVPVQGMGAGEKIAEAIKLANKNKIADVLIIGRGGGSLEDLWPFNEECVARAIYESEIPIISSVGHETDFTIADFVADLRAPTPSAAAELAVPDISKIKLKIAQYQQRYKSDLIKKIEVARLRYEKCMKNRVFTNPKQQIENKYQNIEILNQKINTLINKKINESKTKAVELISRLDALSPLKTLTRGYSVVMDQNKNIVKSSKKLNKNDLIMLKFIDGEQNAKII
jgi:exodeoxyribonuclease VII large subunit